MEKKIKFSNKNLYNYYLTMLLINNSSKNYTLSESCEEFLERFKHFYNVDESSEVYVRMFEYSKLSIEYYQRQSAIAMMFHLFEQFIKVFFNISTDKDYFSEANKIVKKYDYKFEDNTYYEVFNKYRLLNNAIKHGGIKKLEKLYPELINIDCDANKYGTILDNSLNIDDSIIDECCVSLCEFISEMYAYFYDNEYIEE